ncbi:hypothetical protein BDY24DRAFT_399913 [Mrakia frigida]|uniref:mitofusin n=1 Tax=Mrakia frigida TaxID=29902 RepID=UPI003FCC1692
MSSQTYHLPHVPVLERSQSTFSPSIKETEGGFPFEQGRVGATEEEKKRALEDALKDYETKRDRLSSAINSTSQLLEDFSSFNNNSWEIRYPQPHSLPSSPATTTTFPPSTTTGGGQLRRSHSVQDEPSSSLPPSTPPPATTRSVMQRSSTLAHVGENSIRSSEAPSNPSGFQVLQLDLSLGPSRAARPLVMSLERASIAKLLDGRLHAERKHLASLQDRIHDKRSTVLVTGDLNAGKSTFVNALLRRDVLPVDQQPCTTVFCTVHDARDNGDVEEVHIDRQGKVYDQKDESTFERISLKDLEDYVVDSDETQPPLKVYVSDTRTTSDSLLHNGVVDISLIDAPGLNRDSVKTTAVFARQDEIDVVVFVVSAANHFTLSAKELIWTASNEKAYLFIVVNGFDRIRDKERCKRVVLDQIRQLSPRTYEDADELVHFVDSHGIMASAGLGTPPSDSSNVEAFDRLEASLRSFVLDKRAKSKLLPAQTFVHHLLSDLDILASANIREAQADIQQALDELARTKPILDEMKRGQEGLERGLEGIEDEATSTAEKGTRARLGKALEAIGAGRVAPGVEVALPVYPGLLDLWEYAQDVKAALLASLDASVALAEDEARQLTVKGVNHVAELGDRHLPEDVERPKKVFKPEVMFARLKSRRKTAGAVSSVGNVGLGLATRPDLIAISFGDLFDVQHQYQRLVNPSSLLKSTTGSEAENAMALTTTVGLATSAFGVASLVGSKTIATRTLLEGVLHLADLLKSPAARKWAGPIVAVVTIGLGVYVVSELPTTIPRKIGSSLKTKLEAEEENFVMGNGERVARETKRVLRAAGWELNLRFAASLEQRGKEVRRKEEEVKVAKGAVEWFEEVGRRTGGVRKGMGEVCA